MTELQTHALKLDNVSIHFGGLKAVSNLSFTVESKKIFGLIGPNGAGKTTVFNMLTGIYTPTSGRIEAYGKEITGKKPFEICECGMSRTFQNIRLFKELTILENMLIALDKNPVNKKDTILSGVLRNAALKSNERQKTEKAAEILELFGMQDKAMLLSKQLPYGDQRRLEIARALATGAKTILLDEPAAGMSAAETESLMNLIRFLRDKLNITIVLIEHDMHLVMNICERIAVLDYGEKIAEGLPDEIKNNPAVIEAYLGSNTANNSKVEGGVN